MENGELRNQIHISTQKHNVDLLKSKKECEKREGINHSQFCILHYKCGGVAQLGEHLPCKQGVRSSILLISTT